MKAVKEKLNTDIDKNRNYIKVKTVVDKFVTEILDKIITGTKEAISFLV
ncbi:hypothetical protein bpSLO_001460 (plasmid) [Borrelia parkeri]|nr:hypothetical protein bpSLO_001460 [Borrelia parkeri]